MGSDHGSDLIGSVFSVGYRRHEDGGAIREGAAGGVGGGDEPAVLRRGDSGLLVTWLGRPICLAASLDRCGYPV